MSSSLLNLHSPLNSSTRGLSFKGTLPPKPKAEKNPDPRRRPYIDDKSERQQDSMVSTYPLLRRILQSRKLLSDSINLRGFPDQIGLPVEVANPNLKYEFLEYLVEEENEAQAVIQGRDRGGRGRLIKDSEQQFNEMAYVTLSKIEAKVSQTQSLNNQKDDWTRLRHESIMSLGARKTQFRTCALHNEELVMYDKLNQKCICCRCLAVMQLRPDYDTKEVVMADDYCLQWSLKWRDLSQKISQLKEIMTNRATINGLLYSQIQNYVIKEVLHARFKPQDFDPNSSPLVIHQFAQRIFEAEQLALDYETTASADSVHSMELSYLLYCEDLKKLNDLLKNSDLLRENLIVENVGRFLVNQLDDADNSVDGEKSSNQDATMQYRLSTLNPHRISGLGGGHESMRSTLDESPDIEEFQEHGRQKSILKGSLIGKPPAPLPKKLSFSAMNPQPIKSTTKATVSLLSHARSASSLSQPRSTRTSDKGCVAIGKVEKRAVDDDFWEDSKQNKDNLNAASTHMVDLLHNLSSLRIQLRQACALAETLKQNAIQAELRGDAFKALELMSETHQIILKIRSLEERIEEAKRGIVKVQQSKELDKNQSRNQAQRLSSNNKNLTQSLKRSTSASRPFKYLKNVI